MELITACWITRGTWSSPEFEAMMGVEIQFEPHGVFVVLKRSTDGWHSVTDIKTGAYVYEAPSMTDAIEGARKILNNKTPAQLEVLRREVLNKIRLPLRCPMEAITAGEPISIPARDEEFGDPVPDVDLAYDRYVEGF